MPNASRSIVSQMYNADLFLKNVNEQDLLYSFKGLGYDESLLYDGKKLYMDAQQKVEEKNRLENDYRSARSEFQETYREARKHFMTMKGLVRKLLLNEVTLLNVLKINGITPRTFLGWTTKANHFYQTIQTNPEVNSKFENRLDKNYLADGIQMLNDLEGLFAVKEDKKGKFQQSTINQKQALAALQKWYQRIASVCRMIFRKDPKQLVRLGVRPLYPPRK